MFEFQDPNMFHQMFLRIGLVLKFQGEGDSGGIRTIHTGNHNMFDFFLAWPVCQKQFGSKVLRTLGKL